MWSRAKNMMLALELLELYILQDNIFDQYIKY